MKTNLFRLINILIIIVVLFPCGINAQFPKKTLIEIATNASCMGCAGSMDYFKKWYEQHKDEVIPIAYHAWWPGRNDPMFLYDSGASRARIIYYGIDKCFVPYAVLDGKTQKKSNADEIDGELSDTAAFTKYLIGKDKFSPISFSFAAKHDFQGQGSIKITLSSKMEIKNKRLRIVIVENSHFYPNAGNNGEKDFPFVFRQILPDTNGTIINLAANESKDFEYNFLVKPDFAQNLYVAAFIQDDVTKEVIQADSYNIPASTVSFSNNIPPGRNKFTFVLSEGETASAMYTLTNNSGKDLEFKVIAEKSKRTPDDWMVNASDTLINIPNSGSVNVSLNLKAGSTIYAGDALLSFQLKDSENIVYRMEPITAISKLVAGVQVNDGLEKHSLYPVISGFKGRYDYPSIGGYDLVYAYDSLNNLKTVLWNSGGDGILNTDHFSVLKKIKEDHLNLLYCGGIPGPLNELSNFIKNNFGITFSDELPIDEIEYPNNIYIRGYDNDPISWNIGKRIKCELFGYIPSLYKLIDVNARPILSFSQIKKSLTDSIIAVRIEKPERRAIFVSISPFQIMDSTIRNLLIKNIVNWLEYKTDSIGEIKTLYPTIINIFPNPADNFINLEFAINDGEEFSIEIYNMFGKILKEIKNFRPETNNNELKIDLENYPAGLYFCKFISGKVEENRKFIVVK